MSAARLVLANRLRAARQVGRTRPVERIAAVVSLIMSIATVVATAFWLGSAGHAGDGEFPSARFWALLMAGWMAILMSAGLATLQNGLGADEAALLVLVPMTPADRFRSLVVEVAVAMRLEGVVFLGISGVLLGRGAAGWALLAVAGAAVAMLVGVVITLAFVRGLGVVWQAPGLRAAIGGACLAMLSVVGSQLLGAGSIWGSPAAASVPLALLLAGVGPGAALFGRLYVDAFQELQGRSSRTRRAATPFWARAFVVRVLRRRTPIAAMLYKETLVQTRNKLNLLRFALVVAAVPLFPWLSASLGGGHDSERWLLVAFASGLGLYSLIDFIPSPIGSEGDRLALYLTAPLSVGAILRG